jgi:cytosine/adenosine deaminase-related metal-dependent hydrolase
MICRARAVVTMEGPPIENGAVAVEGAHFMAAGRFDEVARGHAGPVVDLGDRVLLPGLINAHCHLDYTMMRKALTPPTSFTQWIQRINGLKRGFTGDDYARAVQDGFAELKKWGTTSVLNIGSFPEIIRRLPPPPVRTWWCFELIDALRPVESMDFGGKPDGWDGAFGLSPHAPYTASPGLYRCALETGRIVTTHLAESVEEKQMFSDAAGPLYEFLKSLGRDMGDCGNGTPAEHLARAGALRPDMVLAHVNEVADGDLPLLEGAHIVHCPRSHRYFGHTRFPLERLLGMRANICLGTDSLASNDSLSLFSEMRVFLKTYPHLAPHDALAAVTVNPARALGMAGRLGCIRPGALADAISVPFAGAVRDAIGAVVGHSEPVDWMLRNGEVQDE